MITVYVIFACIFLCILLSAFFSSSEMAFSAANQLRLENLAEDGDKKAKKVLSLARNYDSILSSILIGNNLVNIAASSLTSVLIIMTLGEKWSWAGTAVLTLLIIIFGETIPKIASKRSATKTAMRFSTPVQVLNIIFMPVTWLVVKLVHLICLPLKGEKDNTSQSEESVEELQTIIETAEDEGILDSDDSELLHNAIDFAEVQASEAMTARVDVQAIDIDDDWDSILDFVQNTTFSRIPVYQGTIDNVKGIMHLNRFLQLLIDNEGRQFDISTILMEPCYVYKTMKLPSVLSQLKSAKQHLAIVTDEYSGTLGVITMEDVLEQVVGEIWDETDTVENDIVTIDSNTWEVDGDLPVSEFTELAGIDPESFECDSETVGGWTIEQFDRFPSEGESFEFANLKITVLHMDGRRVARLKVRKK